MRLTNLAFLPAVLGVAGCVVAVPSTTTPSPRRPAPAARAPAIETEYPTMESRIFALVNAERKRHGLPALALNERLDQAAKHHARNMARYGKMAHVIPESDAPTLTNRAQHVAYYYAHIAENIALGYRDAESVVRGWMDSPGHRRNILSRDIVEIGTAVVKSSSGGLYFCQVFGRRLTSI
jgi:uncharacterized protein YkwD